MPTVAVALLVAIGAIGATETGAGKPPPPPANASAINVACVGDSITQGYLSTKGMTYPNQLQTMLGSGYKVTNFGAGGRTMLKKGDNPYWRTGPLKQALASKPAIVVLMLGTNDAKWKNWGPLSAEFPVDYKSMIDAFKNVSTKPKIYLMVPPPLYQDGRCEPVDAVRPAFRRSLPPLSPSCR